MAHRPQEADLKTLYLHHYYPGWVSRRLPEENVNTHLQQWARQQFQPLMTPFETEIAGSRLLQPLPQTNLTPLPHQGYMLSFPF